MYGDKGEEDGKGTQSETCEVRASRARNEQRKFDKARGGGHPGIGAREMRTANGRGYDRPQTCADSASASRGGWGTGRVGRGGRDTPTKAAQAGTGADSCSAECPFWYLMLDANIGVGREIDGGMTRGNADAAHMTRMTHGKARAQLGSPRRRIGPAAGHGHAHTQRELSAQDRAQMGQRAQVQRDGGCERREADMGARDMWRARDDKEGAGKRIGYQCARGGGARTPNGGRVHAGTPDIHTREKARPDHCHPLDAAHPSGAPAR
ncbi:hypothetical protein DFH09DRAFT_1079569 [Mycena vulgaris]|nr:hypothetical protein DFH09DRAFT_1079569 [Mycena vulgaris]